MNSKSQLKNLIHPFIEDIKSFGKTDVTYESFKMFIKRIFEKHVYEFGDSETIWHIEIADYVDRDSCDGEEAEGIQCDRRFNTFFKDEKLWEYYKPTKKENKIVHRITLTQRLERNKQ